MHGAIAARRCMPAMWPGVYRLPSRGARWWRGACATGAGSPKTALDPVCRAVPVARLHSLRGVCFVLGACAGGRFGAGLVRLLGRFFALLFVHFGHGPQQAFGQPLQLDIFGGRACASGFVARSGCGRGRCASGLGQRGNRRCRGAHRCRGYCGWCRWGGRFGRCRRSSGRCNRRSCRCGLPSHGYGPGRRAGCCARRRRNRLTAGSRLGAGGCLGIRFGPLRHGTRARARGCRRGCTGCNRHHTCRAGCVGVGGGRCAGRGVGRCPGIQLWPDVGWTETRQINGAACHRYIHGRVDGSGCCNGCRSRCRNGHALHNGCNGRGGGGRQRGDRWCAARCLCGTGSAKQTGHQHHATQCQPRQAPLRARRAGAWAIRWRGSVHRLDRTEVCHEGGCTGDTQAYRFIRLQTESRV